MSRHYFLPGQFGAITFKFFRKSSGAQDARCPGPEEENTAWRVVY
jgi:hypothetical protein